MPGRGMCGRVVQADSFGGTGKAVIDGAIRPVRGLRGSLLSCGDLVVVLEDADGEDGLVVDVIGSGEPSYGTNWRFAIRRVTFRS